MSAPHIRIADDFYEGMCQAVRDAEAHFVPAMRDEYHKERHNDKFERALNNTTSFTKRVNQEISGAPRAPFQHSTPHFMLEYFAAAAALNLYRLPEITEQFKAELLSETFFHFCTEKEAEWLGVENAELPKFEQETGYALGYWRISIIQDYLRNLEKKSSRDADTAVTMRHFLTRMGMGRIHGLPTTPALQERLSQRLERPAGWLKHYLKFHPF